MKKSFFIILFFVANPLFSQSITGNLEEAKVLQLEDGILIYGWNGEKSEKNLTVIKYDLNLTEVKRYSKIIPVSTTRKNIYMTKRKNSLFIFIGSAPMMWGQYFLLLDGQLNELSSFDLNKAEYDKINKETEYCPYVYERVLSKSLLPGEKFTMSDKVFVIYENSMDCFLEDKTKLSIYTHKWKCNLGTVRCKTAEVLFVNDKYTYVFINDELSKNNLAQFIYCLDAKTGSVSYKTQLNRPEDNVFSPSQIFLNDNKVFIIGNYSGLKNKELYIYRYGTTVDLSADRDYRIDIYNSIFLLEIDNNTGKISNTKIQKYQNFPFEKSDAFKEGKEVILFHDISVNANNELVAIGECFNTPKGAQTPLASWIPIGYIKYKFDKSLNIIDTKFFPKQKVKEEKLLGYFFNSVTYLNDIGSSPKYVFKGLYSDRKIKSFCNYVIDKENNMAILYKSYLEGNENINAEINTYYLIKQSGNGDFKTILIPKQVDKKKEDSQCFLRDVDSVFLFTPKEKDMPYKIEIINL